MAVKKRLADLLIDRGWTLTDLAERADMKKQSVSLIVKGQLPAWPNWRRRIAKALGVPESAIIWELQSMGKKTCSFNQQ